MKRLMPLAGLLALLLAVAAGAQDKRPAELSSMELRTLIQTDKKGLVARGMQLSEKEAAAFWPLYDAFQKELEGPQREINRAMLDYAGAGSDITDANAKRLTDQVLAADAAEAKIRTAQFKKLLKALPATKAARYMQIENKISSVMRYEAARAIPLAR